MKIQLILLVTMVMVIACTTKTEQKETEITTPKLNILVGTYTDQASKGIYRISFDPATGAVSDSMLLVKSTSPSYLATSSNGQYVFAVNETQDGGLTAFSWNDDHSQLQELSLQKSKGDYPCYVALNSSDSLLALANYGTGNVVFYPVSSDGSLSETAISKQHEGTGPNEERQEGPHAHFSKFSPDGKSLYAIDLGIDQVIRYAIKDGEIGEGQTALTLEPGDGPRHLVFHPSKPLVYVINELSNVVVAAKVLEDGSFESFDRASTLPEGFEGNSYCADIHISDDGRYLYASNRGHNSIAIFSLTEEGKLHQIATESVHGDWPRNFTLSPDNHFLLVANKKSDNITVFKRDKETGMLHYTDQQIKLSQPVCLVFEK